MGLPVPAAVALIYTVGVCLGLVALVISRVDRVSAYLLAAAVGIMGLLSGACWCSSRTRILPRRVRQYRG